MTDSRVALGMDRLPWLPDEPAPRARPARTAMPDRIAMLGWVVAAMLVVAGVSYWVGLTKGGVQSQAVPPAEATFRLPDVSKQAPPASAQPAQPAPRIEPMVAPPIAIVESQRPVREVPRQTVPEPPATAAVTQEAESTADQPADDPASSAPEAAPPPPPAKPVYTGPWPARVVEGASGRLVRIGTFRTSRQAKKGWWAIVKLNPALKRLPALVVPVQSHRNGQVYYRLQMGTTSQAHSAVLCQRMRMIGQSCVIIDERRA